MSNYIRHVVIWLIIIKISFRQWFTSLDVSSANRVVLAGDTKGIVHVMSNTGSVVSKHKLYKDKVTHIEFNSM